MKGTSTLNTYVYFHLRALDNFDFMCIFTDSLIHRQKKKKCVSCAVLPEGQGEAKGFSGLGKK